MFETLVDLFTSVAATLSAFFGQMQIVPVYEVWNTPPAGQYGKFSEAPSKAKADEVAAALKVLGGASEVRGPVPKVVFGNAKGTGGGTVTPPKDVEPTWAQIKAIIANHEGNIPHMYLDINGYVTVGIGNMMPNVAAAQALKFFKRGTETAATAEEIKKDFDKVKGMVFGKDYAAGYYKASTELEMKAEDRDTLYNSRIAGFEAELSQAGRFPDYATYPVRVRAALLDMAFNMGTGKLFQPASTGGFPKFVAAIQAKDWAEAAKQCNRVGIPADRNAQTKKWLEDQAKAEAAKKTPGK